MMLFNRSKILNILIAIAGLMVSNAHAQQVAYLDSGVDPDEDFNIVPGFNYFLNTSDTSDVSSGAAEGHGTISARLISESFTGEIVPFVITDGAGLREFEEQTLVARDSALSDVLGRDQVKVVGMTWGTEGVASTSAPLIGQLSNSDKVIAIMAGNNVSDQPSVLATTSFNLSGVIIVGATNEIGLLLPESNLAGTTANKYVAAIGLADVERPELGGGTSWATARISGIAGAVFLQNPDLTAEEVVEIILESAEDRGEEGTDAEYGRGVILSAEQVLNNAVGEMEIPTEPTVPENTGGGGGSGSSGAGLILGAAVAGGIYLLTRPKTTLEKTLVLDSYGRAFEVDLTKQISINDGVLHLNNFFQSLDQKSVNDGFLLPSINTEVAFSAAAEIDHRIDMVEYFAMPGDVVMQDESAQMSFALASQLTNNVELAAGYKVSPNRTFGAVSTIDSHELFGVSSFISGQSFGSILSGFSAQAETVSIGYSTGKSDKLSTKLGFVSVDQSQDFGQDSFSSILEGEYQVNDNVLVSAQFGQIEEQGSLLGGSAGGAFGVDVAETYALNFAGRIKASDKFTLVGNYGMGRTRVDAAEHSLLDGFSRLDSNWYSLGLIGNNVFRAKDQFGVAFSQPLKIRSGEVDYSIPVDQDLNYNIVFDTNRVDLSKTNATEHNLEAYYRTMISDKLEFGSFISYRHNPNHVSELGNELLVMATLQFRQ